MEPTRLTVSVIMTIRRATHLNRWADPGHAAPFVAVDTRLQTSSRWRSLPLGCVQTRAGPFVFQALS